MRAHRAASREWMAFRATSINRMHQLLATLKRSELVCGDGGGRHARHTLTATGVERLNGASAAVAAVQERMLASFKDAQRRRLYSDLAACADALGDD